MFELRTSLKRYIIVYILFAGFLWYTRPAIMFHPVGDDGTGGDLKEFGTGYGKTIFYYPMVLIFVALVLFYLHQLIES